MDTNNYNEIGTVLKHAREERNLTLEQASHALHIRSHYLEALESGQFSQLPGLAYGKGYLQTYALFLGLDRDEIIRRFEQVAPSLARRGFFLPLSFRADKIPGSNIVWGSLGGALLVYAFWWLIFRQPMSDIQLVAPFSQLSP